METISSNVLRKAKRQTLVRQIYNQILSAICSGQFPPRHRLVIDTLAGELGVSITPVREALRQLQQEGLVTEIPYTGMQVSGFSLDELRELFGIRGVLEGYAVRLAMDRLTENDLLAIERECSVMEEAVARGDLATFREHNVHFHEAILSRAGSGALADMIGQVTRKTERYRAAGGILDQSYLEAAQAGHRQLVALLREHRAAEAEMLVRSHALMFANYLAQRLEVAV